MNNKINIKCVRIIFSERHSFQCLMLLWPLASAREILKSVSLNPIALKKAKIVYNFGLSECNRV